MAVSVCCCVRFVCAYWLSSVMCTSMRIAAHCPSSHLFRFFLFYYLLCLRVRLIRLCDLFIHPFILCSLHTQTAHENEPNYYLYCINADYKTHHTMIPSKGKKTSFWWVFLHEICEIRIKLCCLFPLRPRSLRLLHPVLLVVHAKNY